MQKGAIFNAKSVVQRIGELSPITERALKKLYQALL